MNCCFSLYDLWVIWSNVSLQKYPSHFAYAKALKRSMTQVKTIFYAIIRPEISEKLSVGLIIVDGDKIDVRYSRQKLNGLQALFSEKEYKFVSNVVTSMKHNHTIKSMDAINYMTRYSNNLVAVSPLQTIDCRCQSKLWLERRRDRGSTSVHSNGNL